MRTLALIIIGLVILSSGCVSKEVSFDTIRERPYYEQKEKTQMVILNQTSLEELYLGEIPVNLPEVNFSEEMIIAVFMGEIKSGGYTIEIERIIESGDSLSIYVKETVPILGSGVTLGVTYPKHIVKLKRTDKEVVFIERRVTRGENEAINPDAMV